MDAYQCTQISGERKRGQHLQLHERGAIEILRKGKCSIREIARQTGISIGAICNELKRGTPKKKSNLGRPSIYKATLGQKNYEYNRKRCHKPHKIAQCSEFIEWLINHMQSEKWSFDSCVGRARIRGIFQSNEMVCTKTLYNEIRNRNLPITLFDLPNILRRKRHRVLSRQHKHCFGMSIEKRKILDMSEFGHWEIDTVSGKRSRDACILSLVEKKTRYYIAIKISSKNRESVMSGMKNLYDIYGNKFSTIFKSITSDNGKEFADLSCIEKWGTKIYFAHPYSSWERGQNERHNGLLRRYVPKGVSISNYNEEDILHYADDLNALPRRILGYQTPDELFEEELDRIYAEVV